MANTLRHQLPARTDNSRRYVRGTDKVREDQLRRRAGAAETRLQGTVSEQSADIGRAHQATVRRRQGVGPLADMLIEVYAHESNGRDTTSYLEALLETQLEARGALAYCEKALTREEQELDNAEDMAAVEVRNGEPGGRLAWRRSIIAYTAFGMRAARALGGAR